MAVAPEAAESGARLFVLNGCFACHGPNGEGYVGPRLAGTALSFDDVLRQVRSPRTGRMPTFPQTLLSEDSVADLYAFIRGLPAP